MRRLIVILTALLMLALMAAPAAAKREKPDKPGQPAASLEFGEAAHAEYQPDLGMCVADVQILVNRAGKQSVIVATATTADGVVAHSQEETLPRAGSFGLLLSYGFECNSEIGWLEVTHAATLYDKRGNEVASIEETRLMNFVPCGP